MTEREHGVDAARKDLFSYAVVDAYARNFERAGFGESVAEVRERHAAKDREGAVAAISDEFVDAIDFMGTAGEVAAFRRSYEIVMAEMPFITLAVPQTIEAVRSNVLNFEAHPGGRVNMHRVDLATP